LLLCETGLSRDPPVLIFLPQLGWQVLATILFFFFPIEMGSSNFFAQAYLELQSSQFQPHVGWGDRCVSPCPVVSKMRSYKFFAQASLNLSLPCS
jgi:hypothetical protein